MAAFTWKARDREGRSVGGVLAAPDPAALAARLRGQGLLVLEVTPATAGAPAETAAARGGPLGRAPWNRPPRLDVENSLRQLALMLDSGLTLLEALRASADHARRRATSRVFRDVAQEVERGSTFHEALARHPHAFPPLVTELARAGELSGTLEPSLVRAAMHLEQRREIRAQVAQAMLYPSIVVALAVLVTGVMVTSVIPKLEGFFANSRSSLPGITRALIDVSHFLQEHGAHLSIGIVATVLALLGLDRYPPTRHALDRVTYSLPLIGTIRTLGATALFSRSLSVLIGSGLSLVSSLETTERILRRPVAARAIARSRRAVVAGEPLAGGLEGSVAFAPILPRMVRVGERSGNLERVLQDAAQFHELELRAWIKRASYLVEPVVTLVVGGIVGFVYIAFFLAMFAAAGGLA